MKWILITFLLSSSLGNAFVAVQQRKKASSALFFFPENFDRAVECATHYGTCNLDELEELANGML